MTAKNPHVCEPQRTESGKTSLCRCGKDIARIQRDRLAAAPGAEPERGKG